MFHNVISLQANRVKQLEALIQTVHAFSLFNPGITKKFTRLRIILSVLWILLVGLGVQQT